MEQKAELQQNLEKMNPLTAAQRKAKQRGKQKLIKEGTFALPILEEAKIELKKMEQNDLNSLLKMDKFKDKLNEIEISQLKTFLYNFKQKLKKESLNSIGKDSQQMNLKEKAQRIGNQQTPLLHQSILLPQTYDERKALIQQKIDENLFLFLEYMQNYNSPTQDFLHIILDLYDQFEEDISTKLFVRVCSLYKGEELIINSSMVLKAMQFLIDYKIDNLAAFGLLRLVFQNNISFFKLPINILQDFQAQYEQTILNFFKSLTQIKFQVIESLPATSFCFTKPFLNCLKDGGDILHRQVPYIFLPYIIEILSYSFTKEENSFNQFLVVFKEGSRNIMN